MRNQLIKILLRSTSTSAGAGAAPSFAKRSATKNRNIIYAGIFGLATGTGIGGYYAWNDWKSRTVSVPNYLEENTTTTIVLEQKPNHPVSRYMKYPYDSTGLGLTLYQYQTCPFCCKVRALLDFLGISYKIIEVNPVLRTQLKWSQNYRKVPILIVETPDGKILQLNDSSMIVSVLYSYWMGQNVIKKSATNAEAEPSSVDEIAGFYPVMKFTNESGKEESNILNKYFLMYEEEKDGRSKKEIIEERKWREWADSVYVHTLSPNIYRTMSEALDSFRYFDKVGEWEQNFSTWERSLVIYVGAFAMWIVGKKLQSRHHLHKDVRQSLYEESEHWMQCIKRKNSHSHGQHGDFMGGTKPNLADLAVYGVLSSIEGCKAFKDLDENSTIVKDWYRKVQRTLSQPIAQE